MLPLVQSLESRRLLSSAPATGVVADELKIVADANSIKADVAHCRRTLKLDAQTISADLKRLPNTAPNRSLLTTLKGDVNHQLVTVKADVSALLKAGEADARKAMADGIRVFLNPTNSAPRAKLAADIRKLQTETATPLAKLLGDLSSAKTAIANDLSAIAAANPSAKQLQADVPAVQRDATTCLNTVNDNVQTVQTDVANLLHDLGSQAGPTRSH